MADIHIDDFYKDVGEILLRLYNSFPRKTSLYVEDFAGPANYDEFGLPCERFTACFSTMIWLGDHGYLHYESTIHNEAIDQAVLTHKSFMILSSRSNFSADDAAANRELPVAVLESNQANVQQLRKALKSRSSSEIKTCVQKLLNHEINFR